MDTEATVMTNPRRVRARTTGELATEDAPRASRVDGHEKNAVSQARAQVAQATSSLASAARRWTLRRR